MSFSPFLVEPIPREPTKSVMSLMSNSLPNNSLRQSCSPSSKSTPTTHDIQTSSTNNSHSFSHRQLTSRSKSRSRSPSRSDPPLSSHSNSRSTLRFPSSSPHSRPGSFSLMRSSTSPQSPSLSRPSHLSRSHTSPYSPSHSHSSPYSPSRSRPQSHYPFSSTTNSNSDSNTRKDSARLLKQKFPMEEGGMYFGYLLILTVKLNSLLLLTLFCYFEFLHKNSKAAIFFIVKCF